MIEFVRQQADYILFLHGTALMALCAECAILARISRARQLPWLWLSLSSGIIGAARWTPVVPAAPWTHLIYPLLMPLETATLLCLVEFNRKGLNARLRKPIGRWVHPAIVVIVVASAMLGPPGARSIIHRALVGAAGLAVLAVLWIHARNAQPRLGRPLWGLGLFLALGCLAYSTLPTHVHSALCQLALAPAGGHMRHASDLAQLIAATAAAVCAGFYCQRIRRPVDAIDRPRPYIWALPIAAVALVGVLATGWLATHVAGKAADADERRSLLSKTQVAASGIEASLVLDLEGSPSDEDLPSLSRLRQRLKAIRKASGDCRFAYLMGRRGDKVIFLADAEPAGSADYSPPGSVYEEASSKLLDLFTAGEAYVEGPMIDSYGCWISAVAPVRMPGQPTPVAVLGMDVAAEHWANQVIDSRRKAIVVTLLVCMLLIASATSVLISQEYAARAIESERMLRGMVEATPNAVMFLDTNRRVATVNRFGLEATGWRQDEVVGKSFLDLWPAETRAMVVDVLESVSQGNRGTFEAECPGADGRLVAWNIVISPLALCGSDPGCYAAIWTDITDRVNTRRLAEHRLRRLNECLLGFGTDPNENINRLTALCGELLQADCALYNRIEDGMLRTVGRWRMPEGFPPESDPEGHISTDIIARASDEVCVIRDLQTSPYALSDPNVPLYGMATYVGKAVRRNGASVGALGVLFANDTEPSEEEKHIIQIAASAIETEESRWHAGDALRESEERFRGLFAEMNEGCAIHQMVYGPEGAVEDYIFVAMNPAAERMTGLSWERIRGRRASDVFGAGNAPFIEEYARVAQTGEPLTREVLFAPLGKHFRIAVFSPGPGTVANVFDDITEKRQAEESMRTQISAMNAASDQILIANPRGQVVFANSSFAAESGCAIDQVVGSHMSSWLRSNRPGEDCFGEIWSTVTSGGTWQGELVTSGDNGASLVEDITVTPARNEAGAVESVITIKRNITEKKVYEERLDHLAHHDPLTGLPNRLLFSDRLSQSLAQARRRDRLAAVMFLDLDQFKLVNDTLGHNAGDVLLWQVAGRLTKRLRDVDTIARMGGDEFTIILTDIASSDDAIAVAQRVLSLFAQPFTLAGRELFISTSVGISVFPSDGEDAETLVRNADAAMYRAKEQGKDNYCLYTESLNAAALEQMTLLNNLRKAIQNEEFMLHYQPRVDIRTGDLLGVEALIRWVHPEMGPIQPSQFIPVAEDSGLIGPITDWVLRTACAQNKAWQDSGLPPVEVAVNISARQMEQDGLVATVRQTLDRAGLEPRYLGLELTESALMRNPETSVKILRRIREMGVRVSLDDFGTGHSSLSKLKRLPIDTVKIDQSFVKDINTDHENAAIATAIVAMAHGMRLRVLAEGVETVEQLEFLRALECDEVQGYFIGRPVPHEEIEETLRRTMLHRQSVRRRAA